MHVEVGPVSVASARAWITYATDMLDVLRALPEPAPSPAALDGFASLPAEWRPLTAGTDSFRWESDESPERVKYLINALYTAGTAIEKEAAAGRTHLRPAAADEFHIVLVRAVLDALERESDSDAHFVEEIRNVWGIARRD